MTVNSSYTCTVPENVEGLDVSWKLYAMVRGTSSNMVKNRPILMKNRPISKEILTVRKSGLKDAGLGCFADKAFRKGDYITVYIGEKSVREMMRPVIPCIP